MNRCLLFLCIFNLFLIGCTPSSNEPVPPTITLPYLASFSGSTVRLKTTDAPLLVESSLIYTDDNQLIPDNTQFRLVATGVTLSTSLNSAWQDSLIISSKDGKFKFYVKPYTIAGLYRVNATPIENSNIRFDQGTNARFFIDISAGNPSSIGEIKTDQFEDRTPYNNLKDSLENWIVTANPDLISYISVGPIKDPFDNLLDEGTIGISVDSGSILSENPGRIISGYAYFAYKSDGISGNLNTQVSLFHPSNINLSLNSLLKKASPQLVYNRNADFSNMTVGSTKCEVLNLTNNGAMPASNLDLSSSFPFNILNEETNDPLCPLTNDICHQRQTLRSGESCKVRIKFQMPISGSVSGELISQSSPNEFSGALAIQRLRTDAVSNAQLVTTNSFVSFGGTQCATNKIVDIVVENIGDFDATNISVVNPPPNTNQSISFYSIILPPRDAVLNPNMNSVVNCGTVFPSKRKCRVQISFNPTVAITNQALIGKIVGDNINPLVITTSGYTVPGSGLNTFPIVLNTPNNNITPLGMNLSLSQQTRVEIGPIVDACNQKVADGSIISANVTAGSISSSTFVTNNGSASILWTSSNNSLDLGNQTLTINLGSGGSKTASLLFRGINLAISGNNNFGQVIQGFPKTINLTLTNNGNIDASNLSFSTSSPLIISDQGTCSSGNLPSGQSCQFSVQADPQNLNQDLTVLVNVSSLSSGVNNISFPLSLNARTKPVLAFDKPVYLFDNGSNSSFFEQTLILSNNSLAISYNTTLNIESPFYIHSTNCLSTLNANSSCNIVVRLNSSDANIAAGKTLSVSNEVDTNTPVANLGFSSFEFNQLSFQSIQGRCVGPINFKLIGNNGSIIPTVNITGNLVSNLGGTFYSSSTCNVGSEITTATINSGSVNSSNFYYKNISIGNDTISVSNSVVSASFSQIQLNEEINLNVPSPNGLVSGEELILSGSGGYGNYTYTFNDGLSTSSFANIVDITDPNNGDLLGRRLQVLTQSTASSKIVRVTDNLGFYKDFTFNFYPELIGNSTISLQNNSPISLSYNDFGNPNLKTFTLQNLSGSTFVNGSLFGSTVSSNGVYTPASSATVGTEYVLITIPKATGGSSSFRITINFSFKWPFGTLGDLVINSGQVVNLQAGTSYDYNSITINSGGVLNISAPSNGKGLIILGSVGNVIINGTITSDNYDPYTCGTSALTISLPDPDVNNSSPINTIVYQSSGGNGGAGGNGVYYSSQYGGSGGNGNCGYGGGGGGGSSTTYGASGGSSGGNGGAVSFSGYIGYGGPGMSTYSHGLSGGSGSLSSIGGFRNQGGFGGGSGGGSPSYWGAGGGGGGMRGYTKNHLYIRTKGSILGNGSIQLQGTNGFNGGAGGIAACSGGGGYWGNGGGGGGGAGGNGGSVYFYVKGSYSTSISILNSGGLGGSGGSGQPLCGSAWASGSGSNGANGASGSIVRTNW